MVHRPHKGNQIGNSQLLRQLLQFRTGGTVPDNHELDAVFPLDLLRKVVQQHIHALFPAQTAAETGDHLPFPEAVLLFQLGHMVPVHLVRAELVQLHRIGHHVDLPVCMAFVQIFLHLGRRAGHRLTVLGKILEIPPGHDPHHGDKGLGGHVVEVILIHGVEGVHIGDL